METKKRKRGAGPRLNDLQRLEIIRRKQTASPPVSLRQLAREFKVDEKTIRRVVASSAELEQRSSSAALSRRNTAFRRPTPRFPELEKQLAAWIDAKQRAKEEISPSLVIDKAKLLARGLGIKPAEFKASWGWYDKFCKRYGVRTAFVGVKETRHSSLTELHAKMQEFDPECVFAVEETTLFYDALPFGGDGGARNRLTLVVCCNSTGHLSTPICLVGKELVEEAESVPLPYLTQKRAWLDRTTFGRWFDTVFLPYVRGQTSKPVLLVVDGSRPGHQGDFEQDGVHAVFLPPSPQVPQPSPESIGVAMAMNPREWWTKPLESGVLAALKTQYKYLLVRSALSFHNAPPDVKTALQKAESNEASHGSGVYFGHPATLLDAARLLKQAWSHVPGDLLENCFARANLVPPSKLLAAPALPAPFEVFQERTNPIRTLEEEVAQKIETLLASSSLSIQIDGATVSLRDQVRAFLHLDDEHSVECQKQLQQEISKALGEAAPALRAATESESSTPASPSASVESAPIADAATDTTSLDLPTQIRELLLGITDVASRLRLLPQSGVEAERLRSLQLETCIAAADQIRHCIQSCDNDLHGEGSFTSPDERIPASDGEKEAEVEDQAKTSEIALV